MRRRYHKKEMMMHWYVDVLKKYAVFDGRAGRQEYWMFFLFNILVGIGFSIIDSVTGLTKATGGVSPLNTLYSLAVLVPGIAVGVRRLHDTGRSGLMMLLVFIPCIGAIILLIWFASPGEPSSNAYGPPPTAA
jgi:uncharacterized membrane protein YhaH (DUF805 family)